MLDALSTTLTNTLILLIKSFRLSSIFPALCFVIANYLLFLRRLFDQYGTPDWLKNGSLGHPLLLAFLLAALIGYVLNYLNFPLIYLAEGYPFRRTWWGRLMIAWYGDQRDCLEELARSPDDQAFYADELADRFPPEREKCTPTALGNVIAAFENYPSQRYGIDAVHMWPRLLPVLNEEKYAVFVEREKEGFDFFLNFSALSGMFAVEGLLFRWFSGWPTFTWATLVGGCVAFLSYQAAVRCARNWGETVKTAFDLYRYQLAERLALEPFRDRVEEIMRWEAFSHLVRYGGTRESFRTFRYPLPGQSVKIESGADKSRFPPDEAMPGEAG